MDARIIWIASLIGALLVSLVRKGGARWGLLVCLYATFIYGFVTKAAQGGFEAGLMLPILLLNAAAIILAGAWLQRSKAKKKNLLAPALVLALALALGAYSLPVAEDTLGFDLSAWFPEASGQVNIHFIDVGQGDSILIHGEDIAVLIDAGPSSAGETVTQYLHSRGIKKLDLVVATHPHEDHIGGMAAVLEQFEVQEVMDPGVVHTSRTFEDYLDLVDSKGIAFTEARAGMVKDLGGGLRLEILHPAAPSADDLNDASIVSRLVFGKVAFLFTGDAEVKAEKEMLAAGRNLRAAVLKLGHHGSSTSSSRDFIRAVGPRYAVITLEGGNRYGHPHRETVDLMAEIDIPVYRTDLHGSIVFTTDGSQIQVKSTKHYGGGE